MNSPCDILDSSRFRFLGLCESSMLSNFVGSSSVQAKCIQEVTQNDSFFFQNFLILFPMLYPVLLTKLKLKRYSPSLLILVVEKRLMAYEQSANWLFFKHLDISSFWFPFSSVLALLFEVESLYQTAITQHSAQILSVPF